MKVQTKKNKKTLLVIVSLVILLLLIGGGVFLYVHAQKSNSNVPTDKKDSSEVKQDLTDKENLIKNPNGQDASSPPQIDEGSIDISTSQTSSDVTIFTKLGNIGSGTCTLTVTNGTKTYTQTASIIYQPEFSSCAGFTVPKSSVNGAGTWKLSLNVTDGQSSVTKTSTVGVN